jgi:hypothetical protein
VAVALGVVGMVIVVIITLVGGYAARYPRAPMRIMTRTTRPIVKGDLIVSDLLSCLQVVILIVISFRRFIGSPYLFGFTSVIWGADGVVRTSSI